MFSQVFIFDETASSFQPNQDMNRVFLTTQESYLNHVINARGHLFLNEVLDILGIDRTVTGQFVGWAVPDYFSFNLLDEEVEGSFELRFEMRTIIQILKET